MKQKKHETAFFVGSHWSVRRLCTYCSSLSSSSIFFIINIIFSIFFIWSIWRMYRSSSRTGMNQPSILNMCGDIQFTHYFMCLLINIHITKRAHVDEVKQRSSPMKQQRTDVQPNASSVLPLLLYGCAVCFLLKVWLECFVANSKTSNAFVSFLQSAPFDP